MIAEGRQARDEGVAQAEANPVTPPYKTVARDAIVVLARTGDPFTAEHVRQMAGAPPTNAILGALLIGAARQGVIVNEGYEQATHKAARARVVAVWRGTATAHAAEHDPSPRAPSAAVVAGEPQGPPIARGQIGMFE